MLPVVRKRGDGRRRADDTHGHLRLSSCNIGNRLRRLVVDDMVSVDAYIGRGVGVYGKADEPVGGVGMVGPGYCIKVTPRVEWSWNLLAPAGQAAMRALSVFPGGFSADAAGQLLSASGALDLGGAGADDAPSAGDEPEGGQDRDGERELAERHAAILSARPAPRAGARRARGGAMALAAGWNAPSGARAAPGTCQSGNGLRFGGIIELDRTASSASRSSPVLPGTWW